MLQDAFQAAWTSPRFHPKVNSVSVRPSPGEAHLSSQSPCCKEIDVTYRNRITPRELQAASALDWICRRKQKLTNSFWKR